MEIERLLKLHASTEKEKLGMILSNRLNLMVNGKACITIDNWDILAEDLIKWKKYKESID